MASCAHNPSVEVVDCPDTPDFLFDIPLPKEWEEWYLGTYDPYCQVLEKIQNGEVFAESG